jgi:hypothetical protein
VTVAPEDEVASIAKLLGVPESVGAVVSCTRIVNEPVAVLPAASVAEQFTVVVPIENVEPDAGEQVVVGAGGFASVAVAA